MKKRFITDLFLYRWRYAIGYSLLVLLYLISIIAAAIYAPGGVSQAEIDNIAITSSINFSLDGISIANLPFHLLQLLFFKLFGVNLITIKAPALLLSMIAGLALFFLLRRWFKPNVSVLSMIIMIATSQFLFISQNATTEILYITYTTLTLLFATLIIQHAKFSELWRIALAITVALSLFTPYFWYINLGLIVIAIAHPHPRHFLFAKKYRARWLPAISIIAIFAATLTYLCFRSPQLLQSILGINLLSLNVLENLRTIFYLYFNVNPSVVYGHITPVMDFAVIFIIIFGLLKTLQHLYLARSFMVWSWLLLTLPLIIFQPQLSALLIIPFFILLAIGIESLLSEWYGLFPRNPYARITGLVLISSLVLVLTIGGLAKYVNSYRNYPMAVHEFSKDLTILTREIAGKDKVSILVTAKEAPLYQAIAKYNHPNLEVRYDYPSNKKYSPIYISLAAKSLIPKDNKLQLKKIIVNDRSYESDRFYLYK